MSLRNPKMMHPGRALNMFNEKFEIYSNRLLTHVVAPTFSLSFYRGRRGRIGKHFFLLLGREKKESFKRNFQPGEASELDNFEKELHQSV